MSIFCKCNCGKKTSIAKSNDYRRGWVKGQPVHYIVGHVERMVV